MRRVGVRGEELRGQVVEARADLDAVDAAGRRVGGRLAVPVDHLADLAPRQLARLGLEAGAGDAGRRHGSRARGRGDHLAAAVEELHEQARVVLVDGPGQAPVCGHDLREISAQRVRGQQAGVVDRGSLDDDQPGAAAGACLVVGDQLVGGQVVVDEAGLVRGRDDPVGDRDAADCQRREQAVEHAATVAAVIRTVTKPGTAGTGRATCTGADGEPHCHRSGTAPRSAHRPLTRINSDRAALPRCLTPGGRARW